MIAAKENQVERRSAERYAIQRDVRWRLKSKRTREAPAAGRTVNISSSGVLFTTSTFALPGIVVEVAISWPVPTDGDGELQLIARGRLTRCKDGFAAVHFQQREFRARQAQL
ncbi:MAG TPA: PilZ domain-containing protein [Bryobacteraceae bacterium]|nr:PilZ domain-containing protein [Bryobacteraceae bacterium]